MHKNYVNLEAYCFYSLIFMYTKTPEKFELLLVLVVVFRQKSDFPELRGQLNKCEMLGPSTHFCATISY